MNRAGSTSRLRLAWGLFSQPKEVDAVCGEIRSALMKNGMESVCFAVELTARECLNNAVSHGNAGDAARRVELELRSGRKWICLRVSDEGAGFNWRKRRMQSLPADNATFGRGLAIAAAYAERIRFNRKGNQITLWLSRQGKRKGQ
jgi:anti-sigma regulatory factor (Ser/Thr protein kinase)